MAERFIEIIEENKVGGKSMPSYYGFDGKPRYMNAFESTAEAQSAANPQLKTINEESLKGTGDIAVAVPVPVVEVTGTTPTQQLAPNTFYKFGSVDSLTLTLGTPTSGVLNIYAYSFTASSSFDTSTSTYLPEGVVLSGDFAIEEGQTCEISIQDGRAAFMVWDAPENTDAPAEPVVDG